MPKKIGKKQFRWSPKIAYAVGLLATDGNLSKDGRHIILRSSDIEQIQTFKKCLDLHNIIGASKSTAFPNRKICYRLQFSDVQFYKWLLKIGLFPAKTYTLGRINVPNIFFRDFLRGHLDGDGSITTYNDSYNTYKHPDYQYFRMFLRFISVSKKHIFWLRKTINKLTKLKGDLSELRPIGRQKVSMWQLKFMKKESMKLIPWLYYTKNIPALKRKRQKAEEALDKINNIKRKPYTRQIAQKWPTEIFKQHFQPCI